MPFEVENNLIIFIKKFTELNIFCQKDIKFSLYKLLLFSWGNNFRFILHNHTKPY